MLPILKFASTALYSALGLKSNACVLTESQPYASRFCQKLIQKADALNV